MSRSFLRNAPARFWVMRTPTPSVMLAIPGQRGVPIRYVVTDVSATDFVQCDRGCRKVGLVAGDLAE